MFNAEFIVMFIPWQNAISIFHRCIWKKIQFIQKLLYSPWYSCNVMMCISVYDAISGLKTQLKKIYVYLNLQCSLTEFFCYPSFFLMLLLASAQPAEEVFFFFCGNKFQNLKGWQSDWLSALPTIFISGMKAHLLA